MGRHYAWRARGLALTILAAGVFLPGCGRKHGGEVAGPCNPTISQITPDTGDIAGGDVVTIDTACFQDDFSADLPEVFFGTVGAASVSGVAPATIQAVTPPHPVGIVDVTVQSTNHVQSAVAPAAYTFEAIPPACTITDVTPDRGSVYGGDVVWIDGTGFDTSPDPEPTVEFGPGNTATRVRILSDFRLEVDTPPGTPGPVTVIVWTPTGSCAQQDAFEYVPPGPCTATAATPGRGFNDMATTVFIDGTNFDMPPLPTPTVEFGPGNYGTDVRVTGRTRLVVDTPIGASPGLVDVIVTIQMGPCVLPGAYEFLSPPPQPGCSIVTLDPPFGPDFGLNYIRILGSGFSSISRVWIGGAEVTPVFFVSETELKVQSPPGSPGSVDVRVDIGGGTTCALPGGYTYITCGGGCNAQSVTPDTGGFGDRVTVNGSGFESGAIVFFGIDPDWAPGVVVDETGLPGSLDVIVPSRRVQATTVDVRVVNPSGSCCTKRNAFTYIGCRIRAVIPYEGTPIGGANLLIEGTGFTDLGGTVPEVWFGTERCTFVYPYTVTELLVQSPPANGQTAVEVTVVYPSGETCSYCCYNYKGCVIDSIVPSSNGADLAPNSLSNNQ